MLDGFEQQMAAELASPAERRAYLASHSILRRELAGALGVDPQDLVFARSCPHCGDPAHGKPHVPGSRLDFSLSHGDDLAAVCLGPAPVGVDIENAIVRKPPPQVSARCCTPAEEAWLDATAPERRNVAFLFLWTRKEAVTKALGTGLASDFRSLDVTGSTIRADVDGRTRALALWTMRIGPAVMSVAAPSGSRLLFQPPPHPSRPPPGARPRA